MSKAKTKNSNSIIVETEIKFIVIEKNGKSVDVYGTGDYSSRKEYHVNRKQTASDIPVENGGTMESNYGYSDELIMIHNNEGVQRYAKFDNINLANIFCEALNAMDQAELMKLNNEDEFKSEVFFK